MQKSLRFVLGASHAKSWHGPMNEIPQLLTGGRASSSQFPTSTLGMSCNNEECSRNSNKNRNRKLFLSSLYVKGTAVETELPIELSHQNKIGWKPSSRKSKSEIWP